MRVPVCEISRSFTGSQAPSVFDRFDCFVGLLESLYGVSLPRPAIIDNGQLKQFVCGLLEGDGNHPWRERVRSLSSQARLGLAHSLFLFRKVIPQEKPLVRSYVDKMAQAQAPPDPSFLSFALEETRKLFPVGWDRSYQDACLTSSLPRTSCSEVGRRGGGCRGVDAMVREHRAEFLNYVLSAVVPRTRGVSRVEAVLTGGKWRIISIPPRVDNALRPLHKAIYSSLSRFPWLLRGDAKPARFKDFTPVAGEVFVSGDYESATDNLNADLQVAIMAELLDRAVTVPLGIRDHALSIYRSVLSVDGVSLVQARGQLMGQLTSFPLLCLINYITFRYSIRRRVPVRINGDDIVFRATPDEFARWERNVVKGGLTLSKGKTLIHSRGFTLNSTPFWSCRTGARAVGFVRASAIWKQSPLDEQIVSLSSRFRTACSGYGKWRKDVVQSFFLLANQRSVHASRRSLTRGLGLAVGREVLHAVGLWNRELFYLEQVEEPPLPRLAAGELPPGWRQVPRHLVPLDVRLRVEVEWSAECVWWAWVSAFDPSTLSSPERLTRIMSRCSPYGLGSLASTRVRSMLGLSRRELWRWVNLRRNESVFGRVRWNRELDMIWVPRALVLPRVQVFEKWSEWA